MKRAALLILLSFVLGQCTNAAHRLAQKDMKVWCEIATNYNPNSFEDKVTGAVTYSQKVSDTVRSPEIMNIYKSVSVADPNDRLDLIYKGAEQIGLKNYNCPAFDRLYHKIEKGDKEDNG